MEIKLDKEHGLYVIPIGNGGYSTLGFEECRKRSEALDKELGLNLTPKRVGTKKAYNAYRKLKNIVFEKYQNTGFRSKTELTAQLIGLEGKRVEVVTSEGKTERFYVGKSTGWIPCHLMVKRIDSMGGEAVYGAPFKSVKVLR